MNRTVYHVAYSKGGGYQRSGGWAVIKEEPSGKQYQVASAHNKKDATIKAKRRAKKDSPSVVKEYYKDKSKGTTNEFVY